MSYTTKDLQIASCIMSEDIPLVDWEKTEMGYVLFSFDDKERCEKIEKEWFAGTLIVNAKRYADSVRTLKSIVFRRDLDR